MINGFQQKKAIPYARFNHDDNRLQIIIPKKWTNIARQRGSGSLLAGKLKDGLTRNNVGYEEVNHKKEGDDEPKSTTLIVPVNAEDKCALEKFCNWLKNDPEHNVKRKLVEAFNYAASEIGKGEEYSSWKNRPLQEIIAEAAAASNLPDRIKYGIFPGALRSKE